jgi:hypothetical protein
VNALHARSGASRPGLHHFVAGQRKAALLLAVARRGVRDHTALHGAICQTGRQCKPVATHPSRRRCYVSTTKTARPRLKYHFADLQGTPNAKETNGSFARGKRAPSLSGHFMLKSSTALASVDMQIDWA